MRYFWTANKLNFNMTFTEQNYSSSFKSYSQLNLVMTFSFSTTTAAELLEYFKNDFFPHLKNDLETKCFDTGSHS